MDALADVGNGATEEVAAENRRADPGDAAHDVEHHVARIGHFGGAGHRRAEGANDRNEAREDDCAAAVFFVEVVGALQVATTEQE